VITIEKIRVKSAENPMREIKRFERGKSSSGIGTMGLFARVGGPKARRETTSFESFWNLLFDHLS
jgi:hypothetical protein